MSKNGMRFFLVLVVAVILSVGFVRAAPSVPAAPDSLSERGTSRINTSAYVDKVLYADAGNLTELYISTRSQTQSWQGYYGNISGTVVLDDALNYTLYSWTMAEPQGEIYVVNQSVTSWSTAHCFNYSASTNANGVYNYSYDAGKYNATTISYSNLTIVERFYNITADDVDGIDETFSTYTHSNFYVGSTQILQNSCPATDLYQSFCYNSSAELSPWGETNCTVGDAGFYWVEGASGSDFVEVLLQVNNSAAILWTAIIENDVLGNDTDIVGFNGKKWDFEILVAEDGSSEAGQDTTTPYYFYVELE